MGKTVVALPDSADAKEGALRAVANARHHVRASEMLANAELYGMAISHVVLAVEESVKAGVLLGHAYGISPDEESLRSVMTFHKARHVLAKIIVILPKVAPELRTPAPQSADPFESFQSLVRSLMQDLPQRLAEGQRLWNDDAEVTFWDEADRLKQKGFYVDYKDQVWVSPSEFDEADFASAYSEAEYYVNRLLPMIEQFALADESTRESLRDAVTQHGREWLEGFNVPDEYVKLLFD